MSDLPEQVQGLIDGLVESGAEDGVQAAVYRRGELVVDAVAGIADSATNRPVTPDTLIYCAAAVIHVLAERGTFGYDTRVVEVWPEFGAHGKENATLRHVLTHSVGVPAMPADLTV